MFKRVSALLFLLPALAQAAPAQDVDISIGSVGKFCSDQFGFFEIRFENKSNDWVKLEAGNVQLDSDAANANVEMVLGERLKYWNEAQELSNREGNVMSLLGIGALALIGQQNSSPVGELAKLSAGVGATIKTVSGIQDAYRGQLVPEGHLMHGSFIVPPAMAIKRWVLLYSPNGRSNEYVKNIGLSIKQNGKKLERSLPIRIGNGQPSPICGWQASIIPQDLLPKCKNAWDTNCKQ